MFEETSCPECGSQKIHIMLLDTIENRRMERENRDAILLVASKAFHEKMQCRNCKHMWKPKSKAKPKAKSKPKPKSKS